ncbi:MAG: SNF2-related protein, partial [Anaerolineales bacterium]|nr:SNF2-related protein [Anaerolineales bacterium]
MPRLRSRKKVPPLEPPQSTGVRELALEAPQHWSAAPRAEIVLTPDDGGSAQPARIAPDLTYEFSLSGLETTVIEKLAEAVPRPPILVEPVRPAPEAPPSGVMLAVASVARPAGPTPLPRQTADPLDPEADTRLDQLRPYLVETVLPLEGSGGEVLQMLRPHQLEAFQALLAQESLLLADDLGTGKTTTACLAILALFQRGQARRVLLVCPDSHRREWAAALADWCPGLLVTAVHGDRAQRALDWSSPAHVLLADYEALAGDMERGLIDATRMDLDLIVLDSVLGARRLKASPAEPASRLRPRRRWALAGALPEEREDWLTIFRFLTPGLANVGAGTTASE